jgi:hypothetical protein
MKKLILAVSVAGLLTTGATAQTTVTTGIARDNSSRARVPDQDQDLRNREEASAANYNRADRGRNVCPSQH